MIDVLIFTFFGVAVVTGLYCFWVSLRVELAPVPRLFQMDGGDAYSPTAHGAGSATLSSHSANRAQ